MVLDIMVSVYLILVGLVISLSAKTRTRFLIGVEMQMIGIIMLALQYASFTGILATLAVLMIALEAMKVSAAIGLR